MNDLKINKNFINIVSIAIVAVFAAFLLIKSYTPDNYDVNVGDICPTDIFASGEIVDEVTTKELREQAMELVQPNYEVILGAKSESITKAEKIMKALRNEEEPDDFSISGEYSRLIVNMTQEDYEILLNSIKKALEVIMTQSVSEDNFDQKELELKAELENAGVGVGYIDTAFEVARYCLDINVKPDYEAYEKARQESAASVEPVVYRKGAKIIDRGEVIGEKHYAMMVTMGYIKDEASFNFSGHIGRTVVVLVMFALSWAYFCMRQKKFYERYYLAYCSLMLIQLLVMLIFVVRNDISYYLAPTLMVPMLMAILFGSRISIVTNVVLSIISVLAFDSGPDILATGLIVGSFAAIKLSRAKSRSKIFYATAICAVLSAVVITAYDAGVHTSILPAVKNGLYSAFGVALSGIIAIGLVPAIEIIFGILTPFKLTEFTNFESPLLKKMIVEAPGTYHHSLMVGNLAENAANEIGADSLLTRAGAYYHDVGKLKRPQMFKENQYSDNPHELMSPEKSAEYILSHTSDGVELAKRYKLPKELADFIDQHHGTTLTAYFYHAAKEKNPDVDEELFRYKGRKPQTKEAAIIMLADTVEAAMRTISEYSYEETDRFISGLIKSKIDDGQFAECDVTFRELEMIKLSFLSTLKGYFHKRVKYPGQANPDAEKENDTNEN